MFRFVNPLRKRGGTYAVSPSIINVAVPGSQGGLYRLTNLSHTGLPDTCHADKKTQVSQVDKLNGSIVQAHQARHSESYLPTGEYNVTSVPCASVPSHTQYMVSNS